MVLLRQLVNQQLIRTLYQIEFEGQGLVEYAFIILLIALVVIGVLILFGFQLSGFYQQIIDSIP